MIYFLTPLKYSIKVRSRIDYYITTLIKTHKKKYIIYFTLFKMV